MYLASFKISKKKKITCKDGPDPVKIPGMKNICMFKACQTIITSNDQMQNP